jgi:hypothetical protein
VRGVEANAEDRCVLPRGEKISALEEHLLALRRPSAFVLRPAMPRPAQMLCLALLLYLPHTQHQGISLELLHSCMCGAEANAEERPVFPFEERLRLLERAGGLFLRRALRDRDAPHNAQACTRYCSREYRLSATTSLHLMHTQHSQQNNCARCK